MTVALAMADDDNKGVKVLCMGCNKPIPIGNFVCSVSCSNSLGASVKYESLGVEN